MRPDFGFRARWTGRRSCLTFNPDHNDGAQTGEPQPLGDRHAAPLDLGPHPLLDRYGLFVLIALRGLCGVINDQLTSLRTARAARSVARVAYAPIPRDTVLPGFAPAVHAEA
jgi:hypothetical protein